MSREHMMQAMREMRKACLKQWNGRDSCRKCPLFKPDRAEPLYDEDRNEAIQPKCEASYPSMWDAFYPELREKKMNYPKYAYSFMRGDEEFEAGSNTLRETIIKAVNDEYNEDYFLRVVSQGPDRMVLNGELYVGIICPLPEILFRRGYQLTEVMRGNIAEEIGMDHSPLFTMNRDADIRLTEMLSRTFWSWAKTLEDPGFAVRHIHRLKFHRTVIELPES